ncbi:MAG: DUF3450 domain-containing protein [Gammaproteobacteria bacterium]|nr:DUF3450 domain-containing protein [Gammaproteobacteria bacterium]
MKKNILVLFLLLSFSSENILAATELESLQNISGELVKIRQKIESMHNQISFEKESYRDKMRSYSSQKSDLGVRISRNELNIKDLKRELKKLTEINEAKTRDQKVINPILEVAIEQLRNSISISLPFKLNQRLQALNEIEQRLNASIISPNKAANQLWAYVEDELMLGKSSGIYNDTLKINNQEKLVKVLRIGKVAMFYKTQDGQYGVTKKQGSIWQQEIITDSDSTAQLEYLFDSFSKNIRNGQFSIPNFLPKS